MKDFFKTIACIIFIYLFMCFAFILKGVKTLVELAIKGIYKLIFKCQNKYVDLKYAKIFGWGDQAARENKPIFFDFDDMKMDRTKDTDLDNNDIEIK